MFLLNICICIAKRTTTKNRKKNTEKIKWTKCFILVESLISICVNKVLFLNGKSRLMFFISSSIFANWCMLRWLNGYFSSILPCFLLWREFPMDWKLKQRQNAEIFHFLCFFHLINDKWMMTPHWDRNFLNSNRNVQYSFSSSIFCSLFNQKSKNCEWLWNQKPR